MRKIINWIFRVLRAINFRFTRFAPGFMKKAWVRYWYDIRIKDDSGYPGKFQFNNYGYVPLTEDEKRQLASMPQDDVLRVSDLPTPSRLAMMMYHHVAGQIKLENADVLEVGCGRGWGCHYTKRYLKARRVVGVDISKMSIDYCRKYSAFNGISFQIGDAEKFPFDDKSYDVVVNIESSHCYPNIYRFFKEVHRILKSEGHFLYADVCPAHQLEKIKEKLRKCNLKIVSEKDITANVLESLRQRSKSMEAHYRKIAHNEEEFNNLRSFSAVEGSEEFKKFQDRDTIYFSVVTQNGSH